MTAFGWCSKCKVEHRLGPGQARQYALKLMQELKETKRIDYCNCSAESNPAFSTEYLFGPALGQMFGVLECENEQGSTVILRAFSCQYNGAWNVEGWAPPLFDTEAFDQIMIPGDVEIKELGRKIESLDNNDEDLLLLKRKRKNLSQTIMKKLHGLYELRNFHGETGSLGEFFKNTHGIPTGAGDCCAPKLLKHAFDRNLRPIGIAEFYWGKPNRSGSRAPGQFYASCASRCQPILGFMLCGVQQ